MPPYYTAAVAALSLLGCASKPYWYPDAHFAKCANRAPAVVEVDKIQDGKYWEMLLCFEDGHSIVMLDKFIPAKYQDCVKSHYKRHLKGWDHAPFQYAISMDCGDGRRM